ncbi:hypothetical protein RHGRI_013726 [Rhododendron griersonianum]|uniref:Alpha/beta hydrolase fold-3 domain-containing protein n=1 Tax=Rhododendron griersonianum TaxID=479676 RepID=A0AAV6K6Y0_9ERIC|nr:hypothetical protein RHGRI_013726 [Rhododendron griersonianum]
MVPSDYATPAVDPQTGVESKDVVISPETGVKARIFLPKIDGPDQTKLPLLVHYHVTISVDYRLAPEHPLPTAYDDSWSALQWIATHLNGKGPELWLNEYVDYGRIFLTGDSAGANIAHHLAVRIGATGFEGFHVCGAVIVHPYFAVSEPDKMIEFLYPGSSGTDTDPKLNPKADPDLEKMSCEKVLVFVAEKDWFKPRGVEYCETLKRSGWKGNVELVESEGENHFFHVPSAYAPPAIDPQSGVESKDVVISPETGVKARIFLPKIDGPDQTKLPLLVHYHGGAFCVGSSLDIATTRFLNILTSVANAITVSVDYRLAPEHPLPIAYSDSWSALQWIATHLNGEGPELWLNEYVDFGRIFLMGDSAGANIAHHMAVRVGF